MIAQPDRSGTAATGTAWGAASRPRPGSDRSGDAWCVVEEPGRTLFAVIDGLGHGGEAHEASGKIAAALRYHWPVPLADLLSRCHDAARRTRGGAVSVAEIDVRTSGSPSLAWLGVGNVEGSLWRPSGTGLARLQRISLAGGVVGYRLPRVSERRVGLEPGDVLLLSTDGTPGAHDRPPPLADPPAAARTLLERHAIPRDDALVLVAGYRPSGARP